MRARRFAAAAVAVVAIAGFLRAADDSPGASADVSRWIDELGAPQFARREAAARNLEQAGRDAIAPLVQAMRQGDLEVASRGVEIVCGMLDSSDPEMAVDAEQALERLAEHGGDPVAHVAAAVLEFHFLGLADEARMHLESVGATLTPESATSDRVGFGVFLGPAWRGTADDFRQLTRLRGVVRLRLHGVPVDAAGVAVIGRLRGLRSLHLYGTGIDEAMLGSLATKLPDAEIDVRKGGKLGVSATGFGGPCEIRHVQPGSAAELGGVRSGDVVVAIDGEPIEGFEGLTARVARHGAGETITLAIERPGIDAAPTRVECTVRLDAW